MVKVPEKVTPIDAFIAWIGSIPSLIFHSILFLGFFVLTLIGPFSRDLVLLIWNTIVSLEAIYLAIFIQFSVNRNTRSLREVEVDIDEIQEDVEELGEDFDEIQEDIEEMTEDVEEIQEGIKEIGKDVDEMQEDIEELSEEDKEDDEWEKNHTRTLEQLTSDMRSILEELEHLKKKK
jgi:uncharacterized protein YoxC